MVADLGLGNSGLSLVADHDTGKVVWGAEGMDAGTLDGFFAELGESRSTQIEAVSMDLGPAFRKSVTANAAQATICFDPFHGVKVATDALNAVRRWIWQELRRAANPTPRSPRSSRAPTGRC